MRAKEAKLELNMKKINFETVEKILRELGLRLSSRLGERIKRWMAKFTEQNELDNLASHPVSCCTDPKETIHKSN